jgi:predicted nucleic acid-binding protein
LVLGQPGHLREWKRITEGAASGLLEVECLRTLDRLKLSGDLGIEATARRREAVYEILGELSVVEVTKVILHRAAQPMPAPLGTLDAIHLATAELWRESRNGDVAFATHDRALALAARASGFPVIGV